MEPERFEIGQPADDHESLSTAILYGYQSMDDSCGAHCVTTRMPFWSCVLR